MPAIITHEFFGRDLYEKGEVPLGSSADERQAFLLGNQGPDPLFYAVVLAPRLKDFNRLGSTMHKEHTPELLAAFKEALGQFDGDDYAIAKAYSLGFLCHYSLDVNMHPFVYFWQYSLCDGRVEGVSKKDGSEVHAVIESELDEMVLFAKEGKTIADFAPQEEILQASDHSLEVISKLYAIVAKKIWGLELPSGMFASCVKRFRFTAGVFHSPSGVKRGLLGAAEEMLRPYSFIRAMSHRAVALEDSPFANSVHGAWSEPATGKRRTDSFWDIYECAQGFASQLMNAFSEDGFDLGVAQEFVANRSFDGNLLEEEVQDQVLDPQLQALVDKLEAEHGLLLEEYAQLIAGYSPQLADYAAQKAVKARKEVYGTTVFVRGLIEISNYCKNDCLYCGIRKSNKAIERFRLTPEQIYECAQRGYDLGFRTFVLQGGEDPWFTDERLCRIVRTLKSRYPECAVTLSMGERSHESYEVLRTAGADRYLLRHETADFCHYGQLHPEDMSLGVRMACLHDLKGLGYTVGAGFMVGSPFQTPEILAKDLKFIEEFRPEMCGIGPFLPHSATPFADFGKGTVEMTCYLLSLIRLIDPAILLPATTALGTLVDGGREKGILSGANVVMPNLSPEDTRKKYEIYENKLATGVEAAEGFDQLRADFAAIGYEIVVDRGDPSRNS